MDNAQETLLHFTMSTDAVSIIDVFRSDLKKHHAHCTQDNNLEGEIVITSKTRWRKCNIPLSFEERKVFFEIGFGSGCGVSMNSRSAHIDPILLVPTPWTQTEHNGNDHIDVHNGISIGTSAGFIKAFLNVGAKL
jgi:hypothetical protein